MFYIDKYMSDNNMEELLYMCKERVTVGQVRFEIMGQRGTQLNS